MSWRTKRSPRCSYCYVQGHSRNNCPTAKQNAAAGDTHAQRVVERAAIKKCSYCSGTDHTKATCEKLYNDDHLRAQKEWVGILGAVEAIKETKIGPGAFVYGPLMFYANSMPQSENEYELVNYTITELGKTRTHWFTSESTSIFRCSTLAESSNPRYEFRQVIPVPGFYDAVASLKTEFVAGQAEWLRENADNGYNRIVEGRNNLKELTQVIVPASDEEVNACVDKLLAMKPEILNHPDRKAYQRAVRAANKAKKAEQGE